MKRVLIDDDKSVIGLCNDETVVYLQKLPVILSGIFGRQLARPAAGGRAKADLLLSLDGLVLLEELSHCIGDSLVSQRTGVWMVTFRVLDLGKPRLGPDVRPQELLTKSAKNL